MINRLKLDPDCLAEEEVLQLLRLLGLVWCCSMCVHLGSAGAAPLCPECMQELDMPCCASDIEPKASCHSSTSGRATGPKNML